MRDAEERGANYVIHPLNLIVTLSSQSKINYYTHNYVLIIDSTESTKFTTIMYLCMVISLLNLYYWTHFLGQNFNKTLPLYVCWQNMSPATADHIMLLKKIIRLVRFKVQELSLCDMKMSFTAK
jgi:hypothetical protein